MCMIERTVAVHSLVNRNKQREQKILYPSQKSEGYFMAADSDYQPVQAFTQNSSQPGNKYPLLPDS